MKIEVLDKHNINISSSSGVSFEVKDLKDGLLIRRANALDEWHLPKTKAENITVQARGMLEEYYDLIECFTIKIS